MKNHKTLAMQGRTSFLGYKFMHEINQYNIRKKREKKNQFQKNSCYEFYLRKRKTKREAVDVKQ